MSAGQNTTNRRQIVTILGGISATLLVIFAGCQALPEPVKIRISCSLGLLSGSDCPTPMITIIYSPTPLIPTQTSNPLTPTLTPSHTPTFTHSPTRTAIPTPTATPTLTSVPIAAILYQDDFEDGTFADWEQSWADGTSGVIDDGTGNKVWRHKNSGEIFLLNSETWTDYAVQMRFNVIEWKQRTQGNGIYLKLRRDRIDLCKHYEFGVSEQSVVIQGHFSDNCELPDMLAVLEVSSIELRKWITIHAEVEGSQIRFKIDDGSWLVATDTSLTSGGMGIFYGFDEVWFDDIHVWTLEN
jgi:hypothetical protein